MFSLKQKITWGLALLAISSTSWSAEFIGDTRGVKVAGLPWNAISLKVEGPNGFSLETDSFMIENDSGFLDDGVYRVEIMGTIEATETQSKFSNVENGREEDARPQFEPIGSIMQTVLKISNGEIENLSSKQETLLRSANNQDIGDMR